MVIAEDGFPIAAVVPLNVDELEYLALAQSPSQLQLVDRIDTTIVSARLPGRFSRARRAQILWSTLNETVCPTSTPIDVANP